MLSVETELKLANIFLALAEGEKSTEIDRQILTNLKDYNPYQIFTYLDNQHKKNINSLDLLNYLKEKGIPVDELEIKLIILFYDRDFDGVLSYEEFMNMIQNNAFSLGKDGNNHDNNFPQKIYNNNLPNEVGLGLSQLLMSEIKCAKNIITLLNDLKKRYDFNIHDLYHAIKNWNYIEENSLKNFFRRNKISYSETDIGKILKRLDLNGDGKVDFCEFHIFLGFPDCRLCCPFDACNFCGVCCCDSCIGEIACFVHNCFHDNKNIYKQNYNQENNLKYNNISYNENNNINNKEEKNLNLNNIPNDINKINLLQNPPISKERTKSPYMHLNCENNETNEEQNLQNEKKLNIYNIESNQKLNNNYKNILNFNNYKNMNFSNSYEEQCKTYHFDYNSRIPECESSNAFVGPISDNLYLRFSPKRKYSPTSFNYNQIHSTNLCRTNDYCCNFIYHPEPCEKCIENHCSHLHKENSSLYSNNICNNQYRSSCNICHTYPCCCCSVCHCYPCKCCHTCHSFQCKCCPKCHNFPCVCCKECHSPECICCKTCKKYPCKCCPVCHSEECCCCKSCRKYPCECCPKCHFPNCRCCTVCGNYPCSCCQVCHMAKCICCPQCKNYPCKCCPDCHFVNCQCCIRCGCYPCRCCETRCNCNCNSCDTRCNCCHMCGNMVCQTCKSNPCICCPYCHDNPCQGNGCTCGKQCIAMSLNAMNSLNCPLHNVNSMKHNPGCPFGAKCPHGPKCAHPKENNQNNNNQNQNMNNNNSNNNSQNMNNNNQNMNNSHYNNCPFGHNQNNYNPKNSNNSSINNNSNNSNNNNNYQPNNIQNRPPNNKKITYTYSDPNSPYNNMNNNNINDENDQNNQNYENDSNNGPNDNQNYNNNSNDNQNYNNDSDNDDPNNNGPYNNGPYNNNNNIPFQNQNNQNPNENNPNNQNQNQNNPNPNKSCPLSPISSAFPPNSPFFNANEPGENSNWIFCPKCNVYHRCPHPGCDHNPNKRTTTHKCLHEDNLNKSLPNINNINNPNQPNFPNNQSGMQNPTSSSRGGQMNTSRRNKPPRKRDVFSSCPYQEELGQFVDFLGYLMEVESQIEDLKIELARRDDFNFEDIFRIFEVDGKGYIEPEDLKQGLKLLGLDPSDFDIRLLIKRFDLNKQGLLSYTDFFDMVVSFEKKMRNSVQIRPPNSCCPCKSPDVFECDTLIAIKNLFKYIIECEKNINQMRMNFDSLRSKYSDVVQFLDVSRRGVINRSDLKLYLTQFNKFTTSKECDLLFITLDKTRSGEVGINEIGNELMFLR